MKILIVLVVLFAFVHCHPVSDAEWESYKKIHNKKYSAEEDALRKEIFQNNMKLVVEHNKKAQNGEKSYTLGATRFADLTNEEYRRMYLGYNPKIKKHNSTLPFYRKGFGTPRSVDWRKHNPKIIGPVKNQAQCGSCWGFSAVSSIESAYALKTGKYISLSEQQLVDCSGDYGNQGCNGGLMDNAFRYIMDYGLEREDDYPYEAYDDECRYDRSKVAVKISNYQDIPQYDEKALTEKIADVGPISVAIDASQFSFQLYDGGVYDEESCSQDQLDHGVVAVGYDSENGNDYYIVRNSWGPNWGEDGYIRMSRNKGNQCGIATMASYPII